MKEKKKRSKQSKRNIKKHNILGIFILISITIIAISMNIDNFTNSSSTKQVTYKLDGYDLKTMEQDINDGNITLPFPHELGIEPKIGEAFSGYDIDNDGIVDLNAGDSVPVPLFGNMQISAINEVDNIPFTAWLYDDNSYISGTQLTSATTDVTTPWDHDNIVRYLKINPSFTEATGGTVEITLPVGMYFHGTEAYTPAGGDITSVTFEVLSGLAGTGGQGVSTYKNTKTGKLTYTFNELTTNTVQLIIPVAYDTNIWNKTTLTNTNFTNGIPPISVKMTENRITYEKTLNDVHFAKKISNLGIQLVRWYSPTQVQSDVVQSMYRDEVRQTIGYWEEVIFEYTLPNSNGEYAEYVGEISPSSALRYSDSVTIDTSDPTKVVYTFTNFVTNYVYMYNAPTLSFPSSKFEPNEQLTSHLKVILKSYGGQTVELSETKGVKISGGSDITHFGSSKTGYGNDPDHIEAHLAHFSLANVGLTESSNVEVNITFDRRTAVGSRNLIDVTAYVIPHPANTTFTATYSLVDKYNNIVTSNQQIELTSGETDRSGALLTVPMVVNKYNLENPDTPLDVNDVSFKNIYFNIESIPANTYLHQTAAQLTNLSSGNFYGQYNGTTENAYTLATYKETNADGSIKKEGSVEPYFRPTTTNSNSIYFRSISANNYSPQAGNEVNVQISIANHGYPYGTSQHITTPTLYFLAPNGLEIVNNSISITMDDQILSYELSQREVGTIGQTLYSFHITDEKADFGGSYFDESGVLQGSAAYPNIRVSLNIISDPALNYLSEKFSNMFFVKDNDALSNIHSQYQSEEPYDFEQNGTLEKVVKPTTTLSLNIYPNTNQVEFKNEISINEKEFTSEELSYILSNYNGDLSTGIATYRILIQNNSEGMIAGEDFYYYVPVPKTGVTYPKEMAVQNNIIDFELTSAPSTIGDNGLIYDIKYTTKTDLVDAEGNINLTDEDWLTVSQISSFADVTMVKVTGLPRTIMQSYTEDMISLSLKYNTKSGYNNTGYDSGNILKFNSYGWQKYLEGGVENTENIYSLATSVNVMLRYITEYEREITASYDTLDDDTYTFSLPSYFENKNMFILNVQAYNFELVPYSEILANPDVIDTNITDRNFSVTAQMGNGTTYELSEYSNTPLLLGEIAADTQKNILFEIENYYNIADDASPKYVEVVLGDDEGIKYTLKLNIARTARHITEPITAIAEGMLYKLIDNGKTNITITEDSSMTMQYDFTYIAGHYQNLKLQFNTNLPIGTKIRFIDSSDILINDNGDYIFSTSYYYYEVETSTNNILLSDFVDMRTGENYAKTTDLRNERVVFSFIIEFDNSYLSIGDYTGSLVLIDNSGADAESFSLNFSIAPKREFSVNTANANYVIREDKATITVNFSTSDVTGIDTKYRDVVLALRIRFNQDIPIGSYLEIKDKIYLLEESDFILNYGNYFLIPLGNIVDLKDIEYILHAPMGSYTAGDIFHEIVSLEEPQGDSFANVTSSFTVIDPPPPALDITINNGNELVLRSELDSVPMTFNYVDYDDTTTLTVRLYIMLKSEGAYLRQTDFIKNVIYGGTIYTPNQGIILLNPPDENTQINLTLNLNKDISIPNGTYRVVLETNHLGDVRYQDVTNFIVVDKINE